MFLNPMSEFAKGVLVGACSLAAAIWFVFLLSGCSVRTVSITPAGINATSSAFLYCPEAAALIVVDGNRTANVASEASGVGAVLNHLGDNAVEVMKP